MLIIQIKPHNVLLHCMHASLPTRTRMHTHTRRYLSPVFRNYYLAQKEGTTDLTNPGV